MVGNVVTRRADAEGRSNALTRRSTTAQYAIFAFVRVCGRGTGGGSFGADCATADLAGVLPVVWPECKTRNSVVPAAKRSSAVAMRTRVRFRFVGMGVHGLTAERQGRAREPGPTARPASSHPAVFGAACETNFG